jgi:hypothetical protein
MSDAAAELDTTAEAIMALYGYRVPGHSFIRNALEPQCAPAWACCI